MALAHLVPIQACFVLPIGLNLTIFHISQHTHSLPLESIQPNTSQSAPHTFPNPTKPIAKKPIAAPPTHKPPGLPMPPIAIAAAVTTTSTASVTTLAHNMRLSSPLPFPLSFHSSTTPADLGMAEYSMPPITASRIPNR